jgi:hypothetical protein
MADDHHYDVVTLQGLDVTVVLLRGGITASNPVGGGWSRQQ